MAQCKVSVILPLYNAASYLPELFAALCAQTLRDIEVLCVDDGSCDDTLRMAQEQARTDPRFFCYHQENAGAGAARNTGLSHAQGEYLIFLDADDEYDPTLLEQLYLAAVRHRADAVLCPFRRLDCRTGILSHRVGFDFSALPVGRAFAPDEVEDLCSAVNPGPINKLFRRACIVENDLHFSTTRVANDVFFGYTALLCARRIVCLQQELLTVRRYHNDGSISSNRLAHLEDSVRVFSELFAWAEKDPQRALFSEQLCRAAVQGFYYNSRYGRREAYWQALCSMLEAPPWNTMSTGEICRLFRLPEDAEAQATRLRELRRQGLETQEIEQLSSQQWYLEKLQAFLAARRQRLGEAPPPDGPSRFKRLLWKLAPASKRNVFDKSAELLAAQQQQQRRLLAELRALQRTVDRLEQQVETLTNDHTFPDQN